jgi:hypothetical protein
VNSFASHPIEDELGIGAASLHCRAPGLTQFEIQTGFEVWRRRSEAATR